MIPAVVVGGWLHSLGVVRSLARARIPTYIVCDNRFSDAGLSRHCTLLRVPDLMERGLIDSLMSVTGRIGEKAVLFLCDDLQVADVSRARGALEAHYFLAMPTEAMVEVLLDKAKFQAFAIDGGLRVPHAVILDEGRDEEELDALSMPVVVKPATKKGLGLVEHATRADDLADARAVARRMLGVGSSVVVQEWIDGDDDDIYFTLFVCDSRARIVALFTGRKIMCEPPLIGDTALCVAAETPVHQMLEALTADFVTSSRYYGIGGLEFKRDRRTGQFVVVEPTVGRVDWQAEIATLCGLNIPAIAYRTALGEPVETGGAIIDTAVAWRSSARYRPRAGVLLPGTRFVGGYFRRDDPLPAVYQCIWTLRRRLAVRTRLRNLLALSGPKTTTAPATPTLRAAGSRE